MVDFELGRLPERQNAAVAQHVRSCPICQRQGLMHAATERRAIVRKLRHVKPTRRMFSRRARIILLLLTVALLFQLLVFELLQPNSPLLAPFRTAPAPTSTPTPTIAPTTSPSPTATVRALQPRPTFSA